MRRRVFILSLFVVASYYPHTVEAFEESRQAGMWNLKDPQVAVSKNIMGGEPGLEVQQIAEKGIFIEISGWLSAKDLTNASIKLSQITLSGSTLSGDLEASWQLHPHGLGMAIGKNRYYELPHTIVKGIKTVEHSMSGKYRFGKADVNSEATLFLLKNPTFVCLAFLVPEQAQKELILFFGDAKFNLTLPAS
ncbi:MAG: hypothetical protein JW742_05605 [Candidatus Aminicenantes bacterium]|nr:hypothetical protein [Candidatus Aminicenantes bacterium]